MLQCSLCGLSALGGAAGSGAAKHWRSLGFHDEHLQTTAHAPGKAMQSTSLREMTVALGGAVYRWLYDVLVKETDEGDVRCSGWVMHDRIIVRNVSLP
jgi:hypothetical protein